MFHDDHYLNFKFILMLCFMVLLPVRMLLANDIGLKEPIINILTQAQKKFDLPAIAVSVSLPNKKINNYTVGYQTLSKKKQINSNMLFQVGSITKTFTASLMLKLQSKDKLNLNDKLGKYLPQYPKWQDITLRQLLNQTSGTYDYIDLPNWFTKLAHNQEKIWKLSWLADLAYSQKDVFKPGQGWQYSNTNYVLAGMVIKKVTGKSIESLMKEDIFQPYGLENTYYKITKFSPEIKEQLVHGYYFSPKGKAFDMTFENTSWLGSAGAITSNMPNIAIWTSKVFRGKVYSESEFKQLTNVVSPFSGQPEHDLEKPGYGLGYFRMNTPFGLIWFTPGLTSGYRSMLTYMPCTNIVMTYSMSSSDMFHGGSAKFLITKIYETLLNNPKIQQMVQKYEKNHQLPKYCKHLPKAKNFIGLGAFFPRH